MPDAGSGTVLAFDFGARRIGVAVGEELLGQARPLTVIDGERNAIRLAAIIRLVGEWQPVRLVVGLPVALDGGEHEMTRRCRRFSQQMESRFGLPVALVDERFSSSEAEARLAEEGMDWQSRRRRIDAVAAQIILQDYFDARRCPVPPHSGDR